MVTTRGAGCGCARLVGEQALVDSAADELESAHALIAMMLDCMSIEARKALGHRAAVAGISGDSCITRKGERERVLRRLAVSRKGRPATPVQWPQETVLRGAILAEKMRDHLLSQDLAATAFAISDFLDAAVGVLGTNGAGSPDLARLRDVALRFGAPRQIAVPAELHAAVGS